MTDKKAFQYLAFQLDAFQIAEYGNEMPKTWAKNENAIALGKSENPTINYSKED